MNSVREFVERIVQQETRYKSSRRVLQENRFPACESMALCVKTIALDVRFVQTEATECTLSIETEDLRDVLDDVCFIAKFDGNLLSVSSSEKHFHGAELIVGLPTESVVVDAVSRDGDISIVDCEVKRVSITTESSDIVVNGVTCDGIRLHSQNGDVTALNIQSKEPICATSVNGDVTR